ncbi:hypothetical protein C8J57DRAFT_1538478 [Mycena rebaudengoi]|nr:hypothetical protein C8J57DRAFT_1538478 [Mycena rebaudengoi]
MISSFISFVLFALGHTIGAASLCPSEFASPGHRWPRLNLRSARDLGDVMANSARHTPLLPSGLPYAIVPPSGGRQDPGSGLSLISLLFDATQRMSTSRRRGTSRLERRGRSVDYIGRTAELIALISLSKFIEGSHVMLL